jgi:hypothetical protein
VNFPKAEAVTEITELAERFRAAAIELDNIASDVPEIELGTLRREINAVRVRIENTLESEKTNG